MHKPDNGLDNMWKYQFYRGQKCFLFAFFLLRFFAGINQLLSFLLIQNEIGRDKFGYGMHCVFDSIQTHKNHHNWASARNNILVWCSVVKHVEPFLSWLIKNDRHTVCCTNQCESKRELLSKFPFVCRYCTIESLTQTKNYGHWTNDGHK